MGRSRRYWPGSRHRIPTRVEPGMAPNKSSIVLRSADFVPLPLRTSINPSSRAFWFGNAFLEIVRFAMYHWALHLLSIRSSVSSPIHHISLMCVSVVLLKGAVRFKPYRRLFCVSPVAAYFSAVPDFALTPRQERHWIPRSKTLAETQEICTVERRHWIRNHSRPQHNLARHSRASFKGILKSKKLMEATFPAFGFRCAL